MESYKRGDPWDLPEDHRERKKRVSEISKDICDQYDEIFFKFANKVLEKVREDIRQQELEREE